MPSRTVCSQETHPVSFRMPRANYEVFVAVARLRGSDLSSLLNDLCAEKVPELLEWKARRERALLEASGQQLARTLASESGAGEATRLLRELIDQLVQMHTALSPKPEAA